MNKLPKIIAAISLVLLASIANSEEASKLPIFVHYTHGSEVDAHLNLACELGKTSSFSAPYTTNDDVKLGPKWEIFLKPISLINDEVEIETTIFEHGKRVMAPRVKMNLGEPATFTITDANGIEMTLKINTQNSEGLAPVRVLKYKPRNISIADAVVLTSNLTGPAERTDLRTRVSYSDEIEFVGTESLLQKIRHRLAEVDVDTSVEH